MPKASKKLVQALTDATRNAFNEVREAHPKEHFYVFALFSETGEDLQPTCNSEEGLAFSPDGAKLAATDDDGALLCWDTVSGELVLDVRGKHEGLSAVTFLDQRQLAAGGRDVDEGAPVSVWKLPAKTRSRR